MSGHTPGPWRRLGDIVAQDGTDIAIVCLRHDGDECAANASLISAAPDLLSVCQRIANINVFAVDSDVAQIVMQARTVFEMATGEKA